MGTLRTKDAPTQGKNAYVYMGLLPTGSRTDLVKQKAVCQGYQGLITVVTVTAAQFVINIASNEVYTITAVTTMSKAQLAQAFMDLINAAGISTACNLRQISADWAFNICRAATFTLTTTGTTTPANMTAAVVAGAATATAAGTTSITLAVPLIGAIASGQWLAFKDPTDGLERLAKLSAGAAAAATTLAVVALEEAIPAGSVAMYPPEFIGREAVGANESFNIEKFSTLNTGGFQDGVSSGSSATADLSGLYYEFDPCFRTIRDKALDGREFDIIVDYPSPKVSSGVTGTINWVGRSRRMKSLISKIEMPTEVKGFVRLNCSAELVASPTDTAAFLPYLY